MRFGNALQALQDAEYRELAPELLRHPEMLRDLELYRRRARSGEKMLPLPKPKYSLRWIEISLVRRLLKDSKNMSDNDINDVFHSVVPLRYARVVVLDSAFANYASSLKVPAATSAALCGFIGANVVAGSSVRTDGFRQYKRISEQGYQHVRIVVGDPKKASKLFPRVHRVFSLLDRWLLGTLHGSIRRAHLQRYLDEFVFRFNRRTASHRALLFERLVGALFKPVPT